MRPINQNLRPVAMHEVCELLHWQNNRRDGRDVRKHGETESTRKGPQRLLNRTQKVLRTRNGEGDVDGDDVDAEAGGNVVGRVNHHRVGAAEVEEDITFFEGESPQDGVDSRRGVFDENDIIRVCVDVLCDARSCNRNVSLIPTSKPPPM